VPKVVKRGMEGAGKVRRCRRPRRPRKPFVEATIAAKDLSDCQDGQVEAITGGGKVTPSYSKRSEKGVDRQGI